MIQFGLRLHDSPEGLENREILNNYPAFYAVEIETAVSGAPRYGGLSPIR